MDGLNNRRISMKYRSKMKLKSFMGYVLRSVIVLISIIVVLVIVDRLPLGLKLSSFLRPELLIAALVITFLIQRLNE
jgi:hypothetical protein